MFDWGSGYVAFTEDRLEHMKMFRHLSSVFAIATIAPLALAATLAVTPAIAQADQLPNPDWVALLSDYEKNYWQAPTDAGHGGKVLHADTMKLDEDLAVAINHKAAENLDKDGLNAQRKRDSSTPICKPRKPCRTRSVRCLANI